MKKNMCAVTFVLAFALSVSAFAAGASLTPALQDVGRLDYQSKTDYVIVESKDTRLYGVYDTAGTQLIPCEYGALAYVGYGYFEAVSEEGLNNHALLDHTGKKVIDNRYAAYEMIDGRWCAAVTLEPADGEVYDYSGGFLGSGKRYIAVRYDLYDLRAGSMAGSLMRAQYKRCMAHGDYLYVQDQDKNVTVYGPDLAPLDVKVDSIYRSVDVRDGKAVSLSDGRVIAQRASSARVDTETGLVFINSEEGKTGLYDQEGKELIPCEYSAIGMIYESYAPVEQDGLWGLYDTEGGKLCVPCRYDAIEWSNAGGLPRYVNNGYVCVQKDGKLGFTDLSGNVTCEVKYAASTAILHGCTMTVSDMDGSLYIIAADGTQTRTEYTEIDKYSGGDGSLLLVSKGDAAGIVDWHGSEVLPLEYRSYDLKITDGAKAVIVKGTLYTVSRDQ